MWQEMEIGNTSCVNICKGYPTSWLKEVLASVDCHPFGVSFVAHVGILPDDDDELRA
ncbi:hypothetical protein ZHAS_00008560 [Anopheles sinensis]|uniref:Uncharacterized protein n=1 Tax=Anopheles sinensis TaxID=74873 RepID=A0A084VT08_ANOSI|nr:hypothetical protein ZHAS_00008560 [Anopheles sinensis]